MCSSSRACSLQHKKAEQGPAAPAERRLRRPERNALRSLGSLLSSLHRRRPRRNRRCVFRAQRGWKTSGQRQGTLRRAHNQQLRPLLVIVLVSVRLHHTVAILAGEPDFWVVCQSPLWAAEVRLLTPAVTWTQKHGGPKQAQRQHPAVRPCVQSTKTQGAVCGVRSRAAQTAVELSTTRCARPAALFVRLERLQRLRCGGAAVALRCRLWSEHHHPRPKSVSQLIVAPAQVKKTGARNQRCLLSIRSNIYRRGLMNGGPPACCWEAGPPRAQRKPIPQL